MATVSTSTSTDFVVPIVNTPAPIRPLEPGDRLTRAEFERRYEAMPDVKKAELIEGVVHMPSPVRTPQHAEPDSNLAGWLFTYKLHTPGLMSPSNPTVRLDLDNDPQPDNVLMIDPAHSGQAKLDAQGYIEGAPELVAEIASSSVSIDLHKKFRIYRRSGVREYVVWRVLDRAVDWFVLRDSQYVPLTAGDDDIVRSEVFPGLWLNVPAMLDGKLGEVLATLQQGLATPEHQKFVADLAMRQK
ncbi:MAG: Uma2 family endonuclease [Pirellulales bacterium]